MAMLVSRKRSGRGGESQRHVAGWKVSRSVAVALIGGLCLATLTQGPAVADKGMEPVPVSPTASPSATPSVPSSPATAPVPTPSPDSSSAVPTATSSAAPTSPTASPAPTATPTPTIPAPEASQPAGAAGAEFAVPGAIGTEHERLGGDLGAVGPATADQLCGLAGGGCLQTFAHGTIAWSPATGAHLMTGAIEAAWVKYGGVQGNLSYPSGDQKCGLHASSCRQQFRGGSLHDVPGVGTYPVWGGVSMRYESLGGVGGYLGYPREAEVCGVPAGHCVQHFQRGLIYFGPGGTWPIWGGISMLYENLGGSSGYLGYPVAPEQCGLPGGACLQKFQRGTIYFVPGAGTFPVWGGIQGRYDGMGGSASYLGYPVGSEKCGLRGGGCSQAFQRGSIYFALGAGTQAVWGGLGMFYTSRYAQDGVLGYPTTGEMCDAAGNCRQLFQYGELQWIAGYGVKFKPATSGYCPALNAGKVKYGTGGASRVSFAIAEEYRATRVNFITCVRQANGQYTTEWGALGSAGESGFAGPGFATGPTWQKYSPTGSFTVTEAFGLGNPGTSLAYRTLNPYSRWGGQLNGNYNKYFESSGDVFPDENMWYYATRPSRDYRQGVVINYNRPPDSPIVMNAGFAIFLHGNNVPTWGCISLNDGDLLQFMRTAHPGDRFVMGVGYDIFN